MLMSATGDGRPANCPACGAALSPQAVLCIDCGYHLQHGFHLSTAKVAPEPVVPPVRPAVDTNPYASPAAAADATALRGDPRFDLTPSGARHAEAIVKDAQSVWLVIVLASCVCGPAWLVMLPWYLFRLIGWHRLQSQFSELREPNAFSPHGQLAGQFQDARARLWLGAAVGGLFWLGTLIVVTANALGID